MLAPVAGHSGTAGTVGDIVRLVTGTSYNSQRNSVFDMLNKGVSTRSMSRSGKDEAEPALVDGRINFRARNLVHGTSAKQSHEVASSSGHSSNGRRSTSSRHLQYICTGNNISLDEASITERKRSKRSAYSRRIMETSASQSQVRRVTRKKTVVSESKRLTEEVRPATSVNVSGESTVDFWHTSLSVDTDDSAISSRGKPYVIVDRVPVSRPVDLIISRKTMLASEDLAVAIQHLKCADSRLRTVIEMHDGPKFQKCSSAFTALVRSIVFQQLTTKAASTIFGRVVVLCGGMDKVEPVTITELSKEQLRSAGISERKASYLHDLAAHFLSGTLSDISINEMDDERLTKALTAVKGIGIWSVHMFMLFSLHRPDVLPVGDLGVRKGFQKLYQLRALPSPAEMEKLSLCWQPYRSIGSWYMWRVLDMTLPF